MRSLTLHLKLLIAILVILGISVTAYQIFVLGIPVTEDATDDLWNIDAKVEFVASAKDPVKIQMFVPPLSRDFVSLNESFISNNYGVSRQPGRRQPQGHLVGTPGQGQPDPVLPPGADQALLR